MLLTSGFPRESGKKTEILDLDNPNWICSSYLFPKGVDGAVGGLMGKKLLICGGFSSLGRSDECFTLNSNKGNKNRSQCADEKSNKSVEDMEGTFVWWWSMV